MPSEVQLAQPLLPPWVPQKPPKEWTLTDVVEHVKTAMMVELTTIPLYLYAAYSINTTNTLKMPTKEELAAGQDAKNKILDVAIQEMLHLALSGNLLCTLDGTIELYNFRIIPQFPGEILYDKVMVDLDRADQANILQFTKIEKPYFPQKIFDGATGEPKNPLEEYHSIGEFYGGLKDGLAKLTEDHLKNNPDYQFTRDDFPGRRMAGLTKIDSQKIAQDSLELIIEQGEGGKDIKDSHYQIFCDLASKPPSWEFYNVKKNPKTRDYKGLGTPVDLAYTLSLAFDAGYCYLLQTIQRIWGRGGSDKKLHKHLVGNMATLMKATMPSLADILVKQQINTAGDVAAPCFNYYPIKDEKTGEPDTPLEPEDLLSEFVRRLEKAESLAISEEDKKASGI